MHFLSRILVTIGCHLIINCNGIFNEPWLICACMNQLSHTVTCIYYIDMCVNMRVKVMECFALLINQTECEYHVVNGPYYDVSDCYSPFTARVYIRQTDRLSVTIHSCVCVCVCGSACLLMINKLAMFRYQVIYNPLGIITACIKCLCVTLCVPSLVYVFYTVCCKCICHVVTVICT